MAKSPRVITREFTSREQAERAASVKKKQHYTMVMITREIRWKLSYHK